MREKEIANSAVFIMTVWNFLLAIAMILEIVPLFYGIALSLSGMISVIFVSRRMILKDHKY